MRSWSRWMNQTDSSRRRFSLALPSRDLSIFSSAVGGAPNAAMMRPTLRNCVSL